MTWWQAYGRDKAVDQMLSTAARQNSDNPINEETQVFTGRYTPGDKPISVVLLPALFVGDWMWEGIYHRLNAAGWPVIQFTESISLVDRRTARSINRVAARLLEATRLHTVQPLVVAGDSLGGLIAFEFARSFPDQTAGLVVSGAPGLNLKVNEFARKLAEDVSTPDEFADRFLAKLLYDPSRHDIDPERYQNVISELVEPDNLTSMMSAVRAISRYNSRKVVTEIEAPKLFLWGRQDEITPVEDWERYLPKIKNARLVAFDECGHAPMFEKPDEFYAEMVAFLEGLVAAMSPAQVAEARQQQAALEAALERAGVVNAQPVLVNRARPALAFGVDICETTRMVGLLERYGVAAVHRLCTRREAAWVGRDAVRLAAVFALKEAAIKAMAGRPEGFRWESVQTRVALPELPAAVEELLAGFTADLDLAAVETVGCNLLWGDRIRASGTGPLRGAGCYAVNGESVYAASCFWREEQ